MPGRSRVPRSGPDDRVAAWSGAAAVGALAVLMIGVVFLVRSCVDATTDAVSGMFEGVGCMGDTLSDRDSRTLVRRGPDGVPLTWTATLPAAASAVPTVAGDLVLVRTDDGSLVALDLATGATRWGRSPLGGSPPLGLDFAAVVAGDTAYLTDWDGLVHAVDVTTGSDRWVVALPPDPHVSPDAGSVPAPATGPLARVIVGAPRIGAPLAVDATSVFVDAADLVAIDRVTGALRWTAPVGDTSLRGYSQPVLDGANVIVGAADRSVRAFDTTTGAPRWRTAAPPRPADGLAAPNLASNGTDVAVLGAEAHTLGVVSPHPETPEPPSRRIETAGGVSGVGSLPVWAGPDVLVRTETLARIDADTGATRWTASRGGGSAWDFAPAAASDRLLITPGGDGRLHAFDRETGRAEWRIGSRFRTRCGTRSAMGPATVAGTRVIVASGRHDLVAFELPVP